MGWYVHFRGYRKCHVSTSVGNQTRELAALALAVVGLVALFLSRRSARQRYADWDDEEEI